MQRKLTGSSSWRARTSHRDEGNGATALGKVTLAFRGDPVAESDPPPTR